MKRNLILAGVLVVLVGLLLVQRNQQKQVVASGPAVTVSVHPEKVSRLHIERPGEPDVELARVGGGWKLTQPFEYPAQDQVVQATLKTLETLELIDVVSRNPEKRSVFQVDSTGTRVQAWEGADAVLDLVVGKATPDFGHTYVRRSDDDAVYRATGMLTYNFNKPANDWRDKTILKLEEAQISRVLLDYPQEGVNVVLALQDSAWTVASGGRAAAPADSATAVRLIHNVAALNTVNFATDAEAATVDFSKPTLRLRVETDSGTHVVEFAQGEGTRLFARKEGELAVFGMYTSSIANIMKKPDDFKPATTSS